MPWSDRLHAPFNGRRPSSFVVAAARAISFAPERRTPSARYQEFPVMARIVCATFVASLLIGFAALALVATPAVAQPPAPTATATTTTPTAAPTATAAPATTPAATPT